MPCYHGMTMLLTSLALHGGLPLAKKNIQIRVQSTLPILDSLQKNKFFAG